MDIEILKKALERERKARELAESFVENRLRELYVNNIQLSNRVLTQEEFQKDLLDNLIVALFVIDFNGTILKINKEALRLLGLKDDSRIENISHFSNTNAKKIHKLLNKKNLDKGHEVLFYEFVNFNKEKKYVTIKSNILVDSEKNPYAYQAIVSDVTEKHLLNQKLQKQQELEKFETQVLKDLLKSNDIFSNAFELVHHIADFLNTDDCHFYGYINEKLVLLASTKNKIDVDQLVKNDSTISLKGGVFERIIKNKKGELIHDTTKDKDFFDTSNSVLSKIIVPILLDDNLVGVIDCGHPKKNYFTNDELDILSRISVLISLQIKNSTSELEKNIRKKELEATKTRLQIIFESYSEAKVIETKDRHIEFVSNAFLKLFEIPLESQNQLIGLSCEIARDISKGLFLHEDEFVERIEAIIENQEEVFDEILELKDGRFFSRSYSPIFLNGILDGHVWAYKDVTLQVNYDKSLEFQNKKYKNIIEKINLGLMEVDNSDVVLSVNDAFCNMSGYVSEELIGKRAKDVLTSKEFKKIINEKISDRKKGVVDVYEIEILTKTGETKYWLVSGAPNYNINGEITGSIGIHLDITQLKTLILKNEKLISDVTESYVELSSYAHIGSHDLRTPLHSIASCINWLKEENEGKLTKDSLEYISMINDAILDMNQLISSVLQFSELRSSQEDKNGSETHLIVESIIKNLDKKKIKNVHIDIPKPLPFVKLNNTKVKQIFQNLIENAFKYRDTNKNSYININWQEQRESILFSIEDNGIGIAEEHFGLIFNVFKKLNSRTDSSGIGLSIVKRIIDAAGGKIWFDSKLNIGTTFYFTLPK